VKVERLIVLVQTKGPTESSGPSSVSGTPDITGRTDPRETEAIGKSADVDSGRSLDSAVDNFCLAIIPEPWLDSGEAVAGAVDARDVLLLSDRVSVDPEL
jgi:hypothetical protein